MKMPETEVLYSMDEPSTPEVESSTLMVQVRFVPWFHMLNGG